MRIARSIAAVALIAALAGCAPAHTDPGFLVNPTRPTNMLAAIVEGTLMRDDAGCFGLSGEFGDHITVFPAGTTLAEDEESIDIPGLGTVALGEHIDGGGGYFSAADLGELFGVSVPEQCVSDDIALLDPF